MRKEVATMQEEKNYLLSVRKKFLVLLTITVVSLAALLLLNWRITALEREYDELTAEYWDIMSGLSGQPSSQGLRIQQIFDRQDSIEWKLGYRSTRSFGYKGIRFDVVFVLLCSGIGTFYYGMEWLGTALWEKK